MRVVLAPPSATVSSCHSVGARLAATACTVCGLGSPASNWGCVGLRPRPDPSGGHAPGAASKGDATEKAIVGSEVEAVILRLEGSAAVVKVNEEEVHLPYARRCRSLTWTRNAVSAHPQFHTPAHP